MSTPSDPSGSVAPTGDTHPTAYANPWIARSPVPEVQIPYAAPWPAPAPAALAQPQPGDVSQAFIDRTTATEAARAAPQRPAPAASSAADPRIAMRDGGLDAAARAGAPPSRAASRGRPPGWSASTTAGGSRSGPARRSERSRDAGREPGGPGAGLS